MRKIARKLEIGDRAFGWVVLMAFIAFLIHVPLVKYLDILQRQPLSCSDIYHSP